MKNTLLQLAFRILRFLGLACFKISDSFAGEEIITYDDYEEKNEKENKDNYEDNYEKEDYNYNEDDYDDGYDGIYYCDNPDCEKCYGFDNNDTDNYCDDYYEDYRDDYINFDDDDYNVLEKGPFKGFDHLKDIRIKDWRNFKCSDEDLSNFNYLEENASFDKILEESKILFMNKLHKLLKERATFPFYREVLKCIVLGKSYEEIISFSEFSKVKIDAMVRNYAVEKFLGEEIPFTAHLTFLIYLKYEGGKLDALNFTMTSTIQEEFERESILHTSSIIRSHDRKVFLESIGIQVDEDYCTKISFYKEKDEEKK